MAGSTCPAGSMTEGLCVDRFLPVVAAVLTLQCISGLLEAVLLHSGASSSSAATTWLVALAARAAKTLTGLDTAVRKLSEVALIIFMCGLFQY